MAPTWYYLALLAVIVAFMLWLGWRVVRGERRRDREMAEWQDELRLQLTRMIMNDERKDEQ